jgi:FixJ family two-component response regulator
VFPADQYFNFNFQPISRVSDDIDCFEDTAADPARGEKQEVELKETVEEQKAVYVIDDDTAMRESLKSLLNSVGLRVEAFGSAPEFFEKKLLDAAICLVVDVRLPGMSGLDFQAELSKANIDVPIIFITGHGDIAMTVKAMKAGAVEFLTKPFRDQDLLDAVKLALEKDEAKRKNRRTIASVRSLFESLTAREQEVIGLVTAGLMNKQVAAEMGVSEITVKVHRGNVMRKMKANSLTDLVRMADMLGIRRTKT